MVVFILMVMIVIVVRCMIIMTCLPASRAARERCGASYQMRVASPSLASASPCGAPAMGKPVSSADWVMINWLVMFSWNVP